jgi:hypothetical protein
MKYLLLFLLGTCMLQAQDFSLSSAYHLNRQSSYLGATLSANAMTWNNRKVILRAVVSYLAGTTALESSSGRPASRLEVGFESKNTMITGNTLFNVIDVGYVFSQADAQGSDARAVVRETGFMFAFGLGTRIAAPVSILGKYVTGRDNGLRLVMEVDF